MHDGLFGFLKQIGSLLRLLRLLNYKNHSKSCLLFLSYHNVLDRHLDLCSNGAGG